MKSRMRETHSVRITSVNPSWLNHSHSVQYLARIRKRTTIPAKIPNVGMSAPRWRLPCGRGRGAAGRGVEVTVTSNLTFYTDLPLLRKDRRVLPYSFPHLSVPDFIGA